MSGGAAAGLLSSVEPTLSLHPSLCSCLFSKVGGGGTGGHRPPGTRRRESSGRTGVLERWFGFGNCRRNGAPVICSQNTLRGRRAHPPRWGQGTVGAGRRPWERPDWAPSCPQASGPAASPLCPSSVPEALGQKPTGRVHWPKFIRGKSGGTDNTREKEQTLNKAQKSLLPQRSLSTGVWRSLPLSLGEKNETRFKTVFMENRFRAQC